MRSALVVSVLLGCSLGPPPGVAAPHGLGCPRVAQGILGMWTREGSTMEVRADSMIVRDQVEGAIRWTAPAHATIDVVGSHEEHTFGLINGAQLLDVDTDGRARVWTRVSMVPPYPASCFQIRGSLIGEWTDGAASESFEADGRYLRGDARGNWSIPEVGTLEIALGMRVRRYRIALAAPDMLVTAVEGPLLDEDPRGDSSIETRVR